jgi:hypothetical protein
VTPFGVKENKPPDVRAALFSHPAGAVVLPTGYFAATMIATPRIGIFPAGLALSTDDTELLTLQSLPLPLSFGCYH